ncbi:MAG: hypothetical protein LBC59_00965 [Chitinispirillales bacterium]|jgi:hypothetical protein|nr:hypothetical protein [Chitinispirillales bacterium]
MKKHHNIYVLIFIVVSSISICFAQTKGVSKQGEMMFEGRPFFTDSAHYNSYDLGGSPLGLFEKGSPRFDARFDYRHDGLGDETGQYWNAPVLTMGNPGQIFFRAFYDPSILTGKIADTTAKLPLHRFGLVLATQSTSGAIRGAFSVVGFYGDLEWDRYYDWEDRMIGGVERIRFDIGSQVHPLLRLGMFVSGDVRYEKNNVANTERSCQTNLPEVGVNLDVGGEDLPVRGNFDFSYAWSRFVYTALGDGDDRDAIRNDSLSIFLTMLGRFSPMPDDKIVLKPGLLLGFTNNSGEKREPEKGNNYPVNLGNKRDGSEYGLKSFWFGLGAGASIFDYADLHVEYTLTALWLSCGSAYAAPTDSSRTLHHTAFGVSTNINKYVEMPIVITPRVAYFISGSSGAFGVSQPRLSVEPLNPALNMTKQPLYNPQNSLNGFARVSGFTVGVDGQVLEGQAGASVWATFLSSSALSKGGLEFGARIGFLLK